MASAVWSWSKTTVQRRALADGRACQAKREASAESAEFPFLDHDHLLRLRLASRSLSHCVLASSRLQRQYVWGIQTFTAEHGRSSVVRIDLANEMFEP